MKTIFKIGIVMLFFSCTKEYTCVCKTVVSKQDTILQTVKTSKLGSKGFKETCINHETSNPNLKECHLK
jgi:hypothetical protein